MVLVLCYLKFLINTIYACSDGQKYFWFQLERKALSISIYDERQGDAAGALVVKRNGSSINAVEIADYVAKRLPSIQKQLHAGVQFTEKLPANPNRRTLRRLAREEFNSKKGSVK